MPKKAKIYGFFNSIQRYGDAVGIAISDDGIVIASHVSSSESWCKHDLGMNGKSNWKHDIYDKEFPDGWECEFVSLDNIDNHEGLQLALERNKNAQPEETT